MMKKSTRMMLMANQDQDKYYAGRERYGAEDRFRDNRGREHYDNGRYAPMNNGEMWVEDRRDSLGRYVPAKSVYYDPRKNYGDMHYPFTPYVPPVYEDRRRNGDYRPMNKIGFSVEGEMDKIPPEIGYGYRSDAGYRDMDEMAYRKSMRTNGYGMSYEPIPFTQELAEEWTKGMKNADGSVGAHWTMDQAKQIMTQKGIDCDPVEFYAVLNSIYSDYSDVAKKHNINNMDFYTDMAKAWLMDKDAVEDKASAYFEYVVRH